VTDLRSRASAAGAYGWFVMIALTVVNLVASIDRFMMGIVVIPLKTALALSDAQLGLVYGLGFAILYCVAGIPFGWLSSAINRRLAIIVGCVLWTVATAMCAFAQTFGQLFLMRIAVGLGEAVLVPAAIGLINGYVPGRQLGIANGMFFSGSSIGKAIAFIGGGAIVAALTLTGGFRFAGHLFQPWQALFLFAAIPGVVAILLMVFVLEPRRAVAAKPPPFRELVMHVSRERWTYGLIVFGSSALHLSALALAAWAPSFYVRHFQLGIAPAAAMVGTIGITAGILGAIGGGVLADGLSRAGVRGAAILVVAVALTLAIPAGLIAFFFAPSVFVSASSYAVLQLMMLIGGPQTFAAIQHITPRAHRGFTSAILLAVVSLLAMGVGPLVIGVLSDSLFAARPDPLGPALASSIAIQSLAGAIALFAVRSRFQNALDGIAREDRRGSNDAAGLGAEEIPWTAPPRITVVDLK
jgi:MFS family permease